MDKQLAERLSQQLKISLEQVVREEYEILILQRLMDTQLSSAIVFKGGTALRLAYGSPRFSDDLDFSTLAAIPEKIFVRAAEKIAGVSPQVTLVEALSKRFTLFALYKIQEPYLPFAFSIKLEISTRPEIWAPDQDFELRLLTTPISPISVLAQVATIERLWREKQAAWANRRQPRDLYDLWFIAQKRHRPFAPDLDNLDATKFQRELRKYLPRNHWQVIKQWIA